MANNSVATQKSERRTREKCENCLKQQQQKPERAIYLPLHWSDAFDYACTPFDLKGWTKNPAHSQRYKTIETFIMVA